MFHLIRFTDSQIVAMKTLEDVLFHSIMFLFYIPHTWGFRGFQLLTIFQTQLNFERINALKMHSLV